MCKLVGLVLCTGRWSSLYKIIAEHLVANNIKKKSLELITIVLCECGIADSNLNFILTPSSFITKKKKTLVLNLRKFILIG